MLGSVVAASVIVVVAEVPRLSWCDECLVVWDAAFDAAPAGDGSGGDLACPLCAFALVGGAVAAFGCALHRFEWLEVEVVDGRGVAFGA